jgi:hypothetical protein
MQNRSRRSMIKAAGAVALTAGLAGSVQAEEPKPTLWTLEGDLKVHPKYLYRFYLEFGNICALYGADHGREPEMLTRLQLPARVRVRGVLGTSYHAGGTKVNLSPFPASWIIYMDVHEVERLS